MIVVYRCVAAALMQAIASNAAWQSGQSIGKLSYSRLCSLLRRGCAAVANLTANAKWFLFGVVFFFFSSSYFSFLFFIHTGCLSPAGVYFAFRAAAPSALCLFGNPCLLAARLSGLVELIILFYKFIRHQ